MSKDKVSKLKLFSYGLKGASVTYKKLERVGDFDYDNGVIKENRSMITKEMKAYLNALRIHLLRPCGLWKKGWDPNYDFDRHELNLPENMEETTVRNFNELISTCKITQVEFYANGFCIHGTVPRVDGFADIKLSTEIIADDHGYDHYDIVHGVLQDLSKEALDFAELRSSVDDSYAKFEIFKSQYRTLNEEEAIDAFEKISDEKKIELIEEFNTNNGKVTISLDELLDPDSEDDSPIVSKMEAAPNDDPVDPELIDSKEEVVDLDNKDLSSESNDQDTTPKVEKKTSKKPKATKSKEVDKVEKVKVVGSEELQPQGEPELAEAMSSENSIPSDNEEGF